VAAPGHKLISADYSQIELRILAHYAQVKGLQEAFKNGEDIHAVTAKAIFGQATPEWRYKAKAINFGIIYGISAFGLAKNIGMERAEAQKFIDEYFRAFPEIRTYMDKTKAFAHEHEYVETMFGRKCWLRDINNPKLRGYAERAAINAPIQGTGADIIKFAMIRIESKLPKGARMLLQVHDELVFEVEDSLVEKVSALIKHEMESVVKWETPLLADIGVAHNWKEAH
jgi:DNA polymerase-1